MEKTTKKANQAKKIKNRWAVLQIYNKGDGAQPLVHIIDVFDMKSDALKAAKNAAKEMLELYNVGLSHCDRLKFKDVWEQVDNREEDEFEDFGYDPIEDTVCWRVRVVWYTEEA